MDELHLQEEKERNKTSSQPQRLSNRITKKCLKLNKSSVLQLSLLFVF